MRSAPLSLLDPIESCEADAARPDGRPVTSQPYTFLGMPAVFASPEIERVLEIVSRIAPTSASVLITGETGTGKELFARAVHHYSRRSAKPLVDVNCAGLPQQLLESELFGYEKGAFTGADGIKPGLFELADGGTLFLDEIGELDLSMQVKLLRALDGAAYYRLGGIKKVEVDVRIVAATNVDLMAAVEKGAFRRDLFHRLDQVSLKIPPLRERHEDIRALAEYFLSLDTPHLHFSSQAIETLELYSWPGNVRELKNVVIRSACLARGAEIGIHDLPDSVRDASIAPPEAESTMDALEQKAIYQALSQSGGNHERAARLLGISRRTLHRRLKTYRSCYQTPVA